MEDVLEIENSKAVNSISRWTYDWLIGWGAPQSLASYINLAVLLFIVAVLVYLLQFLVRGALRKGFQKITATTKLSFFGYLARNRFPHYLALAVPLSLVKNTIPIVFADFPAWIVPLDALTEIYMVLMIVWILMSIIKSGIDVLKEREPFRDKPMESYIQVVQMIFFLFGAVYLFSTLTGKSPGVFFGAMGAASAVLLLMSKDTIMGFVASIQVTTNDMVRIGDWIEMPKYGADGDVLEINLTTVKVQNWDKTITTIPTHKLVSESFTNWRGMQESKGRRIKRSINIDINTIHYLSQQEIETLKESEFLNHYLDKKLSDIEKHNAKHNTPLDKRMLTNIGTFREYLESWLNNNPNLNLEMTHMVRQLQPTPTGVPIEIYCFSAKQAWIEYERVQSDIFDHVFAVMKVFNLKPFQYSSNTIIAESEK